jgi:hypothetical protein
LRIAGVFCVVAADFKVETVRTLDEGPGATVGEAGGMVAGVWLACTGAVIGIHRSGLVRKVVIAVAIVVIVGDGVAAPAGEIFDIDPATVKMATAATKARRARRPGR